MVSLHPAKSELESDERIDGLNFQNVKKMLFTVMKNKSLPFICAVYHNKKHVIAHPVNILKLLSCQPKVTVTSCFVYKVIRDLESIDHLCINRIHRIGFIHK